MQSPHRRRIFAASACLALAWIAGCSGVHQREALYPNRPRRLVDLRKDRGRGSAPKVNLRVETAPSSEAAGDGAK